ncbi:hypothetical protein CHS0354_032486 [Potamilus streckersoni]|uniref:Potassium channel domain-containing protein n=1 Tax=Potamilus streckersoni TaxID=2493646 RepID=A0AAE0SPU7_9BIVA|nr:hypothetical protein CHS0354_032486 [Potamilus streckersoni]
MRCVIVLIVLVFTFGYLLIGAAIFSKLEADHEGETKQATIDNRAQFLANFTCVNRQQLEEFIRGIIKAYDQGVFASNETSTATNWDFLSSLFFSTTVITTIGYGNISPSTYGGQTFCIIYALFGIPLMTTALAALGEKMAVPINKFKSKVCWKKHKKTDHIIKSAVILGLGLLIVILVPSGIFSVVEDWTFHESVYYSVITLCTIGFGDFVAGQQDTSYRAWYRILVGLWIITGLAWMALILNQVGDLYKEMRTKTEVNYIKRGKATKRHSTHTPAQNGDHQENDVATEMPAVNTETNRL